MSARRRRANVENHNVNEVQTFARVAHTCVPSIYSKHCRQTWSMRRSARVEMEYVMKWNNDFNVSTDRRLALARTKLEMIEVITAEMARIGQFASAIQSMKSYLLQSVRLSTRCNGFWSLCQRRCDVQPCMRWRAANILTTRGDWNICFCFRLDKIELARVFNFGWAAAAVLLSFTNST